jgi:hypothetical protein
MVAKGGDSRVVKFEYNWQAQSIDQLLLVLKDFLEVLQLCTHTHSLSDRFR